MAASASASAPAACATASATTAVMTHLDQALALQTMRLLQEAFEGRSRLGGVLKLALLLGLDGIKLALREAFARLGASALWPAFAAALLGVLRWVRAAAASLVGGPRRPPVAASPPAMTRLAFEPHPDFWQQLLLVARPDDVRKTVDADDRELRSRNAGEVEVEETWRDVTFGCPLEAHIETPLRFTLTYKGDELRAVRAAPREATEHRPPQRSRWATYGDLIPFEGFREDLRAMLRAFGMPRRDGSEPLGLYDGDGLALRSDLGYAPALRAFDYLDSLKDFRSADRCASFNELYYTFTTLGAYTDDGRAIDEKASTGSARLFGVKLRPGTMVGTRNHVLGYDRTEGFRQVALVRRWLARQLLPGALGEGPGALVSVCVAHPGLTPEEAADAWRGHVQAVMTRRAGGVESDVRVFVATIEEGEVTNALTNPEYALWEHQCGILDASSTSAAQRGDKEAHVYRSAHVEHMKKAPLKELVTASRKLKVVISPVSESHKSIATLYLRQDHMRQLRASLDLFDRNRELTRRLGLPHKLGVLLHGPPGTGKSSTVAAIATHLRKDLYYVNIGDAKTNEQLRMLFESIVKNTTNGGGIIVMEDVDAMSDVVHRRDAVAAVAPAEPPCDAEEGAAPSPAPPKSEVTLDYLLNLLQGSLTMDGTVFVATTNCLEKLDPAFFREGRFDVVMRLGACDRYQVATMYSQFFGHPLESAVLDRFREDAFTPAAVIQRMSAFLCVEDAEQALVLEPFLTTGGP